MTSESELSASITYAAMFFQPQKLKFHKMFRNILTPRSPSFIPRVLPASGISERRATQPARKNQEMKQALYFAIWYLIACSIL